MPGLDVLTENHLDFVGVGTFGVGDERGDGIVKGVELFGGELSMAVSRVSMVYLPKRHNRGKRTGQT